MVDRAPRLKFNPQMFVKEIEGEGLGLHQLLVVVLRVSPSRTSNWRGIFCRVTSQNIIIS